MILKTIITTFVITSVRGFEPNTVSEDTNFVGNSAPKTSNEGATIVYDMVPKNPNEEKSPVENIEPEDTEKESDSVESVKPTVYRDKMIPEGSKPKISDLKRTSRKKRSMVVHRKDRDTYGSMEPFSQGRRRNFVDHEESIYNSDLGYTPNSSFAFFPGGELTSAGFVKATIISDLETSEESIESKITEEEKNSDDFVQPEVTNYLESSEDGIETKNHEERTSDAFLKPEKINNRDFEDSMETENNEGDIDPGDNAQPANINGNKASVDSIESNIPEEEINSGDPAKPAIVNGNINSEDSIKTNIPEGERTYVDYVRPEYVTEKKPSVDSSETSIPDREIDPGDSVKPVIINKKKLSVNGIETNIPKGERNFIDYVRPEDTSEKKPSVDSLETKIPDMEINIGDSVKPVINTEKKPSVNSIESNFTDVKINSGDSVKPITKREKRSSVDSNIPKIPEIEIDYRDLVKPDSDIEIKAFVDSNNPKISKKERTSGDSVKPENIIEQKTSVDSKGPKISEGERTSGDSFEPVKVKKKKPSVNTMKSKNPDGNIYFGGSVKPITKDEKKSYVDSNDAKITKRKRTSGYLVKPVGKSNKKIYGARMKLEIYEGEKNFLDSVKRDISGGDVTSVDSMRPYYAGKYRTHIVNNQDENILGEESLAKNLMVLLENHNSSCGGTLYSKNAVISAAHCFKGRPQNWQAQLKRFNLELTPEEEGGSYHQVLEVLIHPNYDSSNHRFDVSVWKIENDAEVETHVELDDGSELDNSNVNVTILGWGGFKRMEPKNLRPKKKLQDYLPQMRSENVPIVNSWKCYTRYKDYFDSEVMICTGGFDAGASCQGDSGGPVFRRIDNDIVLIGIISFGKGCGYKDYYDIHVKVSNPSVSDFIISSAKLIIQSESRD